MIIVAVCLLAALLVPVLGGSFLKLRHTKIYDPEVLIASFVVQVVAIGLIPASAPEGIGASIHLASYALALWFVYANRRLAGVWVVAFGGLLNLAPIIANHGVMPASPAAVARAGLDDAHGFENSAPVEHARLQALGDAYAVPSSVPLANVFSIGDVVLGVGCALILWQGTGVIFFRLRQRKTAAPTPTVFEGISVRL